MSLQPPCNLDAEQATLGAILLNRDALLAIRAWLQPEMFWLPKHALVYRAMCDLLDAGTPPDLRTVADALLRANRLNEIGGAPYLSVLIDAAPTSYHVEHYASEVRRCAVLRSVIDAGERIVRIGYEPGADAERAVADALTVTNALEYSRTDDGVQHISVTVEETIEDMQREGAPCIRTGLHDLDNLIGGLFAQDFLIIAARPAVGKTALGLSMLYNLVRVAEADTSAIFFSLEMSSKQLVQRLAAMECGIDVQMLRRRTIPRDKIESFASAMRRLSALPIYTYDYSGMTPASLRAAVMRHLRDNPRAAVFIDYLQLMDDSKRREGRQQEVSDISRAIKKLAREADVPVVALAQLNRQVEGRASKIPMLSDLRESGSLEQDADIIMFIHREELYDANTDKKGVAELHIAKHRNGPTGVVPLRFDAATTRFSQLTYRTPDGY